ncbi:MAG: isopenicillin N synthase family oxygenase [Actinomycetota bacterium]|nr:isopenicillin N synthase family oxygenase [Actinomycetota bacterium]
MSAFEVPTVDISAYVERGSPADQRACAAAMDAACSAVGFVQIVGHGIPADAINGLKAAMDDFFAQDLDVKKEYRTPPHINRGYAPPKSESLSLSLGVEAANRMNDFFEAFNVGSQASDFPALELPKEDYPENLWPSVEDFQPQVQAYFAEAGRVARVLTDVFADALELPHGFFQGYTDHSIDVLRMNNYALPAGTDVQLDGDLTGMGEHTDYGIVTVLWADQVRGLQVLDHDGVWHDVSPADEALLINLGDLMARWTGDRWMSTLHRVKPPLVDGSIERRRSAAYFHDGNIDATVAAMPTGKAGASDYPPITVGEHLRAKLAGSRAGRSNTAAGSEAERVRAAAR